MDEVTKWLDENGLTVQEMESILAEKEPDDEQTRIINGYRAAVEDEKRKLDEIRCGIQESTNAKVAEARAAKATALDYFSRYIKEVLDDKQAKPN